MNKYADGNEALNNRGAAKGLGQLKNAPTRLGERLGQPVYTDLEPSGYSEQTEGELKKAIAKQFRDSHTAWPEMKPIDWPDTFADKIIKLFAAQLAEAEKAARIDTTQFIVGKLDDFKEKYATRLHGDINALMDLENLLNRYEAALQSNPQEKS